MAIDDRSTRHDTYALTVLARNDAGWRNLKELVSKASLQGYYYVPRIDWATLKEHAEGLIVLSGGLGGIISRTWQAAWAAVEAASLLKALWRASCCRSSEARCAL